MAVDNSSIDQFERWITFSPSQQPSVLPGNKSSGVKEGLLMNSSSIHTTSIAPSVDSTCNSPDKEHTGCITPSSVSQRFTSMHVVAEFRLFCRSVRKHANPGIQFLMISLSMIKNDTLSRI